ncbi:translation initiation factor IF-2-like [Sciurus carolinensis]|uniref:translation initiation factor IF-2-like n=1 Tax=Sciurus carolinensis TaxID=30640 RepID=UPI001FB35B1B|nr:translation initiation factor IF-2-like [Sciurus carolinensis]XP_047390584.1 translation initiation factor IF-2-like [Sciurus carolinensis]XP_047390585.1 translation initiation factor IF-2-like [Sciurus carolinensis]
MNFLIIRGGRKALGPLGSGGAGPGSSSAGAPRTPPPRPAPGSAEGARAPTGASSCLCVWRLFVRGPGAGRGVGLGDAQLHGAGNPRVRGRWGPSGPGRPLRLPILCIREGAGPGLLGIPFLGRGGWRPPEKAAGSRTRRGAVDDGAERKLPAGPRSAPPLARRWAARGTRESRPVSQGWGAPRPADNPTTFLRAPPNCSGLIQRAWLNGGMTTGKSVSLDAICLQFVNPAGKRSPDARAAALTLPGSRILLAPKRIPARGSCVHPELNARCSGPWEMCPPPKKKKKNEFLSLFAGKDAATTPADSERGAFSPRSWINPPSKPGHHRMILNARRPASS